LKALIVDDEKHVRDAIRLLVDWESYGIRTILEAPEGLSAVQLIEAEQPDIIFTDMLMPLMNGSELLEWIHLHAPNSKTIVISGHDDFGFVRHTVKYGGMDYILKPIDEAQLNEALLKAVLARESDELIRNQNQNQSMKLNQIKPIYWDKVFSNLIEEPSLYPSFAKELESEFSISQHTAQVQVSILSLETTPAKLRAKFASNLDLLFYSLANIANEFLTNDHLGYAFRNWNKDHELVIMTCGEGHALPMLIQKINEGIYRTFGVRYDIGIGSTKSFPTQLPLSYQEAKAILRQRNLLQKGNHIHVYSMNHTPRITTLYYNKHQERIKLAMLSSNAEQICGAIDDWFKDVRTLDSITSDQLDMWLHEFTVFRSRCLEEFYSDDDAREHISSLHSRSFIIPLDEEGRLSIDLWQNEITQYVLSLATLHNQQHLKSNNIILAIAEYIETHYQEDITLQHISERFYLSREYISRKFKLEMRENISDFISRIRIDKAKSLLLNPQLRMAQISEMIGYQDEKYFSKVFKKMVGMSPNQYRKKSMIKQ
jgi:two-component system response regulator YesN